jgi:hypothetical protein
MASVQNRFRRAVALGMAAAIVAGGAALIGDWLDARAQVTQQQTLYDAEHGASALFRASTTARSVGDLFPH